ncbi:MAG: hypothetical protein DRG80_07720 [Deltaproteobacteria bacterium]|nr:MAG: hypothetical protein DRG80_07720 [Deltaproteobacteria bacterium]
MSLQPEIWAFDRSTNELPCSKLRGINSLHSHANAVQGKDMRSKRVMDEMIFSGVFIFPSPSHDD